MNASFTSIRWALIVLACVFTFVAGWFTSRAFYGGEQAMGSLIETVSAIGYLEKDDKANALKTLQMSSEGNVVRIAEYGVPVLDWYEPGATLKWLQRYARVRYAHPPIEYPDGGVFRKKVDSILPKVPISSTAASQPKSK